MERELFVDEKANKHLKGFTEAKVKEFWELYKDKRMLLKPSVPDTVSEIKYTYTPVTEGKDHININSKSQTELGLLLSNFSNNGFNHPEHGYFKRMENFYAYLVTEEDDREYLRDCNPVVARKVIKESKRDMEELTPILKQALVYKFKNNKRIGELFVEHRDIPFTHYFWYGKDITNVKVIPHKGNNWLVEGWTKIRETYLAWYDNKLKGKRII